MAKSCEGEKEGTGKKRQKERSEGIGELRRGEVEVGTSLEVCGRTRRAGLEMRSTGEKK